MQKNSARELKLNIIIGVLNQVLSLLINLISKNAIRTSLNLDYLGLQTVFGNFCDIMFFAFPGIGIALMFSLYRPFAEQDHARIRSIYQFYNKLYKRLCLVVLAVGAVATALVLVVVNARIANLEIVYTYLTYLLSIIVYNRFLMQHYFIIASQRRYVVCLITGLIDSAALLAEVLVLRSIRQYEPFLLCILLKNICISSLVVLYLKKKHSYLFVQEKTPEPEDKKAILRNVKDLSIYRIGNVLLNNMDSIFISLLINTVMSGCYSNYVFISNGVYSLISSFFESIIARVGQTLAVRSRDEQFRDFWKVSLIGLWICGFSVTCFLLLVQDFIVLWMGPEVRLSGLVVGLIALNLYLVAMRQTTATYRQSAGIFQKVGGVVLVRGIINLVLSLLLGWFWKLPGILIATNLSNLATLYWYEPYLMYQYFEKPLRYEALYQVMGLLGTAACFTVTFFVVSPLNGGSWPGFLLKAFLCIAISNLCYGIFWLGLRAIRKHRVKKAGFEKEEEKLCSGKF